MKEFLILIHVSIAIIINIYTTAAAPSTEIYEQLEKVNKTQVVDVLLDGDTQHLQNNTIVGENNIEDIKVDSKTEILKADLITRDVKPQSTFIKKLLVIVKTPVTKFFTIPRVKVVLKNVGTCIVNGAMELISFYLPAPIIPLIATAAGMVIPFEPVVTLRRRMPVTSYRRAFKSAMNSFMGTFERFKEPEDDPYMTRRFNRRFMGDDKADSSVFGDKDMNNDQ